MIATFFASYDGWGMRLFVIGIGVAGLVVSAIIFYGWTCYFLASRWERDMKHRVDWLHDDKPKELLCPACSNKTMNRPAYFNSIYRFSGELKCSQCGCAFRVDQLTKGGE